MDASPSGGASNPSTRGASGTARRRSPNIAEQKRRRAWGEQWGQIGKQWKQAHNVKG